MAGSKLASAHDQRALGRGESIHLWPCRLKNACHTRGEKEEACDLTCRYSPAFFYPPAKRRRWEYSPLVLCLTRARFGELSSKFEGRGSSELCSTVSPSTHSVCLNIVQFGENINKCCTIAARQAAEGDMPKRLKHTKIQKYEERSSSITAGGSTRSFSGSPHGRSNDVITVQRQPSGSVRKNSLFPNSQLVRMRGSSVGFVNNITGIQTPIRHETTSIQRGDCVSGRGKNRLVS